jgi:two-component system, NtrC family, response regulator AtoC
MRQSVLIVDDEELIRRSLRMALEAAGYEVQLAASGAEGLARLDDGPDCAIIDLRLGDADGLDVVRAARSRVPAPMTIVITAHGDVDSAIAALRLGAFDYIRKPFDLEEVIAAVGNALHTDALERQVAHLSARSPELVYASPAMVAAMQALEKVARQRVPVVLIQGETGTGKELAARFVHRTSALAQGPFIELNCSAIPETLVESEIFGHERGAFSDAREQKRGLVELADQGTLFLDEIGDLPAPAQAKLLKFVESREFRRLGGTKVLSVDCRLVAATHQSLETSPTFRRDLFFRLAGVTVTLPPLRERGEDVLLLARHFLAESARTFRKRLDGFTPEAEAVLRNHRWPGNVRELRAAITSAAVMAEDSEIGPELLAPVTRRAIADLVEGPPSVDGVRTIEQLERAYAARVVGLCGGNKALAAQRLGITRQTLARWLADPDGG